MDINNFIDRLLEKNLPFVCYFEPNSNVPKSVLNIDKKPEILDSFEELNSKKGFVFAPFENKKSSPIIVIEDEIFLQGYDEIGNFDLKLLKKNENFNDFFCGENEINLEDYTKQISEAISSIKSKKANKIVISKFKNIKRKDEKLSDLFVELKKRNPKVFVYIINIPNIGLWLGATPEMLLIADKNTANTVSLASTQTLKTDKNYSWGVKEIEEQAFVSRYIVDTLNKFNIPNYDTIGPETFETSVVAHLKTSFSFNMEPIRDKVGSFISHLAPTPAVCGMPKKEAKELILKIEKYDRKYYAGFLGAFKLEKDDIKLFVNIRCMEVLKEHYKLYVGGGITAKSIAKDEWDETENKAQTLLNTIKSIQ
ncbi:isochorismate synthase [Campylobacter blaseri]|uniref:Isochorismate synthase n=1 Tax=Campylobacter blaseri TaxID=2042961 RepID=A0A2P8QZL5_9BACT|nr:chorismate-binding protein [Campylobacter blaseri]PSM51678.1 isochorismate synthase [Campylobacter blaseri]PSM53468.1 isochorismate synthase [Campylobacter blaseri]QKF86273.1 isochorismate synthase [Campylobacter blaseri]